jgi:hypothetical protein
MAGLQKILRQSGDVTAVPEMFASYRAVKRKLAEFRLQFLFAGGRLPKSTRPPGRFMAQRGR